MSSMRNFMSSLMATFRKPNDGDETAERMLGLYVEFLSEFDDATLEAARKHLLRHRKDPFLPTIAECVEVCEHAKAGTLGDLLDPEGAKKRAAALKRIAEICGPGPRPVGVYPRD